MVPVASISRAARNVCDGASGLWALGRWRQRRHHEELQKSGAQRSATGSAKEAAGTAKPKAGSHETNRFRCLGELNRGKQWRKQSW